MLPRPTKRAVIDVGHKCSIECTMCYWLHELKAGTAAWESCKKLKDDIFKAQQRGNNYIDATGGEPTLYPHIIELIQHASSLNMKFCIITNGITGKNQTQKILEAGIDDWLVSVHDHAMKLKGGTEFNARERQERFLKQVQEFNKGKDERPYRFNCCMSRENQADLVKTVQWAIQWNPRIFNFINMNPHNDWQKDVEGTKKIIGDLDVLEKQLCEAIPILLQNDIGVNVRYYPMCRLPEVFRQYIANDRHVLFDPYEWDYNITPKTFQTYLNASDNMSRSVEWNGQPCLKCDLKFICGGINSAFFRACGGKNIITPVKINGIAKDDFYHYRRANTKCLIDRTPKKDKELFITIADEHSYAFVPVFIRQMIHEHPEQEFIVLSDHCHHETLREIVDRGIGYGIYDLINHNCSAIVLEYDKAIADTEALMHYVTEKFNDEFKTITLLNIEDSMIIPGNNITLEMYRKCSIISGQVDRKLQEAYPDSTKGPLPSTKKSVSLKNKLIHYKGNLLIYTLCDKNYEWYLPLFARSMLLANPKQEVEVHVVGGVEREVLDLVDNDCVKVVDSGEKVYGKYVTASLRFLISPTQKTFTHYLITDIDMMFMFENSSIIDQHCKHMQKDGTECYENWISQYIGGDPRMPGVHFITQDWFDKTQYIRKQEYEKLMVHGATEYYYDEVMLGRIVRDSGLKLPPQIAKLWRHHGIHLGDWRINMDRKGKTIPQNVFQKMHIQKLLNDKDFIEKANICSTHIPLIGKIIKKWPMLFK